MITMIVIIVMIVIVPVILTIIVIHLDFGKGQMCLNCEVLKGMLPWRTGYLEGRPEKPAMAYPGHVKTWLE